MEQLFRKFILPGSGQRQCPPIRYFCAMCKEGAAYWDARYSEQDTPWDVGGPSTPLKTYIDGLTDKEMRILLPGGGPGHELLYLLERGFSHSFLLDISPVVIQQLRQQHPAVPAAHFIAGDFFQHQGTYDLILEQTFFCALPPAMRPHYAPAMHRLLRPGGRLAGVLFHFPLTDAGPPYGGDAGEYQGYFEPHFTQVRLAHCYNSIPPRAGKELWIDLRK